MGGRVCLGQRMLGMCPNPCETLTEWRTKCLAGFNSCVLQLRVTVLGMHTYNGRHERMGFLDWLRSASSGRGHTWKLVSKRRSQKVVPRLLIACTCCSGRICTQVHAGQGWSIFCSSLGCCSLVSGPQVAAVAAMHSVQFTLLRRTPCPEKRT